MTTQEILEAARAAEARWAFPRARCAAPPCWAWRRRSAPLPASRPILEANAADLEAARGHISEVCWTVWP